MIKLLISDDSAFMRIAIRKMVEGHPDIQVVGEARTGQMCVEMAETLRPDVITMDVEMPVMDGLEATTRLRAGEAAELGQTVPIIALTASVLPMDQQACMEVGMNHYLTKPFRQEDLKSALKAVGLL